MLEELFSIPAFSRASAALAASGLAFPVVGTIILTLELIPARFAVMHVALLGAALVLAFGVDPTLSALAAAILSGLLVARLGESSDHSPGGAGFFVLVYTVPLWKPSSSP